jgi:hypothetical protein
MLSKPVFRACAVLALVSSTQLEAAQAQSCMTRNELRGMVAYMLPIFGSALIERCRSRLPANAYLTTRGPKLISALEAGQDAAWPAASAAIAKIGGTDKSAAKMLDAMPPEAVKPMVESMIQTRFIADIKARDCQDADNIMRTMEPLPVGNVIDLITEILVIGARNDRELTVCATT